MKKTKDRAKAKKIFYLIAFISVVVFILCACVTLFYYTPKTTVEGIVATFTNYDPDDLEQYVFLTIKLPRILGALLIGAFLAVGGSVMQGITKNFLASPDVVGISSGANLGLTIATSLSVGTATYFSKVTFSLLGAAIATMIIFTLSSRIKGRESGVKLLLAGTALGTLFGAFSTAITLFTYPEQGAGIALWNNSGLLGIRWSGIAVLMIGVIGLIIGLFISGKLTILSMGDETATGLGENVKVIKLLGVISVVLISSATVSVVGNIGFIGLIIPNMVKMAVGEDYKKVVPLSAIFGSMLLVVSDVVSRYVNMPQETPIGVITSVIGIPIFLYLVNSRKSKGAL